MMIPLKGTLQHYDWGGSHFLLDLFRIAPRVKEQHYAEYWLGVHPLGPATLRDSGAFLDNFLRAENLPSISYLFKVLDVQKMLSLQAHPSKEQAVQGFLKEEAARIPLTSSERVFKDKNHKPEMCVALSDFYLLSGFKPMMEAQRALASHTTLYPILKVLTEEGYEATFRYIYNLKENVAREMLYSLMQTIETNEKVGNLKEVHIDYWVLQAYRTFIQPKQKIDKGIFLIYLLNLIQLREGQAYFHKQNVLHAYLKGQCIELMTSSDNVLRGGLTSKYVNIDLLSTHLDYTPFDALPLPTQDLNEYETMFVSNAPDFLLRKITLPTGVIYTAETQQAEIWLVIEGKGQQEDIVHFQRTDLQKGEAFLVLPHTPFALIAQEKLVIYRASERTI